MDLAKIKSDIPRMVYEWGEQNAPQTCFAFVSVLLYRYGEVVERTFGMRRYAKKGVQITEVRRRATGNNATIIRNLLFSVYSGYVPVFENKDRYAGWGNKIFDKEDFNVWYKEDSQIGVYCVCLNKDILTEIDEFKYCGYSGGDVIKYLNAYRQNPMIEFFGKLKLPISPLLIKQAKKDKQFRNYLLKNVSEIRTCGVRAAVYGYKHNLTVCEAATKLYKRRKAFESIPAMRGQKIDCDRIISYCDTKKIGYRNYNDYLEAVIALGLNLTDTKNIYPKDFDAMHDLRIREYESQKAKADRKKRKELYKAFAAAGKKAIVYEYSDKEYSIIAPRDISDLATEGKILGHCVGKMGYDKKMAEGKVVIMFLRKTDDLTKPFVTIEYDLIHSKLLQAYAKKNTQPPSEVMVFINKWLVALKKIRKEQRK